MQYRNFGKLGWKPSALGFGVMRLPVLDNLPARIDESQASSMLHYAIDQGVNYLDTAYPYHRGQSEVFLGEALKGGYREKVKLATKLPSWMIETSTDFDRYFFEQLEKLQTDHIDFYLLHALKREWWDNLFQLGVLEWAEKKIAEGKIGYLGFSFHDTYPVFKDIVDAYDGWSFCQIQYNYMDIKYQAGKRGLKYAAEKGLGVVIMEPLRGGLLAKNPPPPAVAKHYDGMDVKRTPTDWALQWLWNQPEVSVVLSGMSTMAHVQENVESANQSGIGALREADHEFIVKIQRAYKDITPIPCTNCRYCVPCPGGIDIPTVFRIFNDTVMFEDLKHGKSQYHFLSEEHRADNCVECGSCEEKCPQGIAVIEWLKEAHAMLEDTNPRAEENAI
ncbi:MAG: aldo/keto reductase [Anaerolineaceae bacterium]|nr:aldo/keto reductase [Anaerolineaceae bacterium]